MDTNIKATGTLNELVISLISLAVAATDYLIAATKTAVVDLRKEELPEVQQLRKEVLLLTLRQTRGDLQRRASQRLERKEQPPRPAQAKPEAPKSHPVKPAMQAGSQQVAAAKEAAKAKREAPLTAKPLAEALKNVVPAVAAAPEVKEPTLEELELLTRPTTAPAAAPAS